jgi:hypothetical protein
MIASGDENGGWGELVMPKCASKIRSTDPFSLHLPDELITDVIRTFQNLSFFPLLPQG